MEDNVSKIKDRLDIVDLVGSYMKLQRAGVNWKARCPFHNEKTPSFFVNPERQIWHCFGCNIGGDHFEFVQQMEGVDFPEALRMLARRAGIDLSPQTSGHKQYQSEKTRLYEIAEISAKFFEKQLWQSNSGKSVLGYLCERGVNNESIKKFRLGFAPDSWNALSDFLKKSGYKEDEVVKAGMAIKKSDSKYSVQNAKYGFYDRFRNRIIFPVFDLSGQIVGFSGRIFDMRGQTQTDEDKNQQPEAGSQQPAKYINTPQTPIYDKSKTLYGLNFAKLDVRRQNRCLVVEGNMDVIMSHQAGACHGIATSGTALTDQHLKIIKRYTDNLDLCFDEDDAGEMATKRGVDMALSRGFSVGIVTVGDQALKDPADYVKKHGDRWAEHALKPKPFMDFFFQKVISSADTATAEGKKLISQKLLPLVKAVANKVEQSHWVSELALKLRTKEDMIYQELRLIKAPAVVESDRQPDTRNYSGLADELTNHERAIAEIVAVRPSSADRINLSLALWSNKLKELIGQVKDGENSQNPKIGALTFKASQTWKDFSDENLEAELDKLINQVKINDIQKRLELLGFEIRETEVARDRKRLADLVLKFSDLSKELQQTIKGN